MSRLEGPLVKSANLGEFDNVVKIADNLEAHVNEQTRGPLGNLATLSNVVAFEINILQINITSSLHTTRNSLHIPGANACARHVN